MNKKMYLTLILSALLGYSLVGCNGSTSPTSDDTVIDGGTTDGGDSTTDDGTTDGDDSTTGSSPTIPDSLVGTVSTTLKCDDTVIPTSDDAESWDSNGTTKRNASSRSMTDVNRENHTSHNTLMKINVLVPKTDANGTLEELEEDDETHTYPLVLNYLQQVVGDYETGDGSADIGDPTHVDAVFVALSNDNGDSWQRMKISDSTSKSSKQVVWSLDKTGSKIDYPGHAQKPAMAMVGKNILVAWNDKYCPSGNPHNLEKLETDGNDKYPDDFFAVNGTQGSIDYAEAQDGSRQIMIAPNGKEVYEVPFSCVWTARGFYDDVNRSITWHAPMQLTTGVRDSNHIRVAGTSAGFSIAWHEDKHGLRSGRGAGPGEGWSGATTNHGTDIWYSQIKMSDFPIPDEDYDPQEPQTGAIGDNINEDANHTTVHSLVNFNYPVRITDNEACNLVTEDQNENKEYCKYYCEFFTSDPDANGKERCLSHDSDWLQGDASAVDALPVILDGDTGASRPSLALFVNDQDKTIVVLGYEETKGLTEDRVTGSPEDSGTGEGTTEDTNITAEGKSVYFESWLFDEMDDFNKSDYYTLEDTRVPLVSAGDILNEKVDAVDDPYADDPQVTDEDFHYENARRLIIGKQIDSCDATEADAFNFAIMYKQSFDTRGASSDMFIRVNEGFAYDDFTQLPTGHGDSLDYTNVSAQMPYELNEDGEYTPVDYNVSWFPENLDDATWENNTENTFSPRIFLRENYIFTGYEYTPDDNKTSQEHMPSNFHAMIYRGQDGWSKPENVTQVVKSDVTTVDARFFTTPKGAAQDEYGNSIASDASNPDVLFVTWGTVEGIGEERAEANLYVTRSTDRGLTWDLNVTKDEDGTMINLSESALAAREGTVIQEKEVQSFATPDGKTIYNVWLQEEEHETYDPTDPFSGLDTWFGRVDYNESIEP